MIAGYNGFFLPILFLFFFLLLVFCFFLTSAVRRCGWVGGMGATSDFKTLFCNCAR